MIDRQHALPITHQAKLLKMIRGSVYYLPKPVSEADLALMRRIDKLHLKHPFMGARMLHTNWPLIRRKTVAGIHSMICGKVYLFQLSAKFWLMHGRLWSNNLDGAPL